VLRHCRTYQIAPVLIFDDRMIARALEWEVFFFKRPLLVAFQSRQPAHFSQLQATSNGQIAGFLFLF
jgi:hypothetical protein